MLISGSLLHQQTVPVTLTVTVAAVTVAVTRFKMEVYFCLLIGMAQISRETIFLSFPTWLPF
ncbi:uncharacterized protein [Blastocystis hominis]|uniref:Uncharacterized protein n=1 Tax=Blastocystis hominis TaxID=12968 RepID=D8M043_BLAHO|nr:uncharacterized protein [Blastocystis hominis]CBK21432.2 unnamed protein product [Blastocystis hominis]|eukprot:XP_012895480.1 uncharacterized protein [Blastocystis hominis]